MSSAIQVRSPAIEIEFVEIPATQQSSRAAIIISIVLKAEK
jgi:hypothetical protein